MYVYHKDKNSIFLKKKATHQETDKPLISMNTKRLATQLPDRRD